MILRNLTPHPVSLLTEGGQIVTIESIGVARCVEKVFHVAPMSLDDGLTIALKMKSIGHVVGLPAPTEGVGYIVSMAVAEHSPTDRHDLYVPADTVRDENRTITHSKGLWYRG